MSGFLRAKMMAAGCITAATLAACGGGGGGAAAPTPVAETPVNPTTPTTNPAPLTPRQCTQDTTPFVGGPGAPLATGNIAFDGREWLNYRRSQVGMSALAQNSLINRAAQDHSDYQRLNDTITHVETAGKPGFKGADVKDRLEAAGYLFNEFASRAYGEVISATCNNSGQYMAEELITAVYHRFVIFEPVFKEIGTGAATTAQGYNYFTANFTANNGYGAGLAGGQVAVWPANGQVSVPRNFFSNSESPDPVPDRDEVGYPISVHANIDLTIRVTSFTVHPRGGSDLAVRLLSNANDTHTGTSSAAIVPLAALAANTTYDVSFTGTTDVVNADKVVLSSTPVARSWSFTTR